MVKPFSAFKKKKSGRPQSLCIPCHQGYMRQHYKTHKDVYKRKAREHATKTKRVIYEWLFHYFKEHPCIDCGESNPIVLEFDHRDDEIKVESVSDRIKRGSLRLIESEVAKCDVRCSNCHVKRTAVQQGFYWVRLLKEIESV